MDFDDGKIVSHRQKRSAISFWLLASDCELITDDLLVMDGELLRDLTARMRRAQSLLFFIPLWKYPTQYVGPAHDPSLTTARQSPPEWRSSCYFCHYYTTVFGIFALGDS
jgi:hypothetical protein